VRRFKIFFPDCKRTSGVHKGGGRGGGGKGDQKCGTGFVPKEIIYQKKLVVSKNQAIIKHERSDWRASWGNLNRKPKIDKKGERR